MPIDYKLYPSNWKQIRAQILERAKHHCERCGIANYATRYNDKTGKNARIVLTIAHIQNPDPMDCRPENLQALCQRCHNRLDAPMRAKKAAQTRKARKSQRGL